MIRYCLTEHSDCNGKYVNEEYNYSEECFCSCHKTKEGLGPGLRNQAQHQTDRAIIRGESD